MKTLVIGLGNPILSDDGIGVKVAYAVQQALGLPTMTATSYNPPRDEPDLATDVTEASVGGLRLMEMMIGYERVIIIDALTQVDAPPGTIYRMTLADLERVSPTQHSASAHDASLTTALDAGRRMGLRLPDDIVIYAVCVENVSDFSNTPTLAVEQAIPLVSAAVLNELNYPHPAESQTHG